MLYLELIFANLNHLSLISSSNTCGHHPGAFSPRCSLYTQKQARWKVYLSIHNQICLVLVTGQNKKSWVSLVPLGIFFQSIVVAFLLLILQISWGIFNLVMLGLSCPALFSEWQCSLDCGHIWFLISSWVIWSRI